jgi:hypothetical protein
VALLARAMSAGPSISAVCTYIHQHEGAAGVRRILGVLALAKKHGPAVVDEAAKAALDLGVPTYRFDTSTRPTVRRSRHRARRRRILVGRPGGTSGRAQKVQ